VWRWQNGWVLAGNRCRKCPPCGFPAGSGTRGFKPAGNRPASASAAGFLERPSRRRRWAGLRPDAGRVRAVPARAAEAHAPSSKLSRAAVFRDGPGAARCHNVRPPATRQPAPPQRRRDLAGDGRCPRSTGHGPGASCRVQDCGPPTADSAVGLARQGLTGSNAASWRANTRHSSSELPWPRRLATLHSGAGHLSDGIRAPQAGGRGLEIGADAAQPSNAPPVQSGSAWWSLQAKLTGSAHRMWELPVPVARRRSAADRAQSWSTFCSCMVRTRARLTESRGPEIPPASWATGLWPLFGPPAGSPSPPHHASEIRKWGAPASIKAVGVERNEFEIRAHWAPACQPSPPRRRGLGGLVVSRTGGRRRAGEHHGPGPQPAAPARQSRTCRTLAKRPRFDQSFQGSRPWPLLQQRAPLGHPARGRHRAPPVRSWACSTRPVAVGGPPRWCSDLHCCDRTPCELQHKRSTQAAALTNEQLNGLGNRRDRHPA